MSGLKDTFSGSKQLLWMALGLVCVVLLTAYLWSDYSSKKAAEKFSFASEISACDSPVSNDATLFACTSAKIDTLLESHTTAELFRDMATGTFPTAFQGCHAIGHIIGTETFKKAGSVEKALAQCTDDCSFACIHGVVAAAAMQELGQEYPEEDLAHMDIKQIEEVGKKYCRPNDGLCHGIGHILFTVTNDFKKAAGGCDAIASGLAWRRCVEGVFMQGSGGLSESLVLDGNPTPTFKVPAGDYGFPCDAVPSVYRKPCFKSLPRYEFVLFRDNEILDANERWKKALNACAIFPADQRVDCVTGIGRYSMGASFTPAGAGIASTCEALPNLTDRSACVLGAISHYAEFGLHTEGADYCGALKDENLQSQCYNMFFQLESAKTPDDAQKLCSAAGSPNSCEEHFDAYEKVADTLPQYGYGLLGEK